MKKLSGAVTFLPVYTASHRSRHGFVDAGVRASNFESCPLYDKLIEKGFGLTRVVCQVVIWCGGVWCVPAARDQVD
jgi:hypothetical protein